MLWSDVHIHTHAASMIDPFDPSMVQPSSIDLTLDKEFYMMRYRSSIGFADVARDNSHLFDKVTIEKGEYLIIEPGQFALASTYEKVNLPDNVAARYEGKSSLGRLGLFTHVTAGFIDPGFNGHITLELFNALNYKMVLYPGMRIGQLCFFDMKTSVENQYGSTVMGSHYQGQRGPTMSRSYKNFKIKDIYSERDS